MTDKAAILIVDDRPEKVLSLEVALEGLGQEIVRAYSGREALRLVLQRDFAVILLDVNMPGMDGFETAAMIRQRKNSEHVPIIFVTSFGDEIHAARGYSLGAVDYILAPVVSEVLRSKVGVFVDLYRKNAQLRAQAETLRRRATQLQKLAAASVAINTAHSLEGILQTIADTARDILGTHQAITLFLGDPRPGSSGGGTGKTLAVASLSDRYASFRSRTLKLDAVATTLMAQSRKPTRMTEAELLVHPDWDIISGLEIPPVRGGILACPLLGRDGTRLGVIYLTDREGLAAGPAAAPTDFTADDEAILTQLSQLGAITMENTLFAAEREANRLKDEFLATLSHELRTPLNAMLGWTEILRSEQIGEEVSHGLRVIERNVLAQTKLVEDLLDVSRITTGKLRLSRQTLSLSAIVESAVDAVRPVAADKRIHLHAVLQPVSPMTGDPDRLQQVIWNLLNNAVKFTPEGGRIQVTLARVGDASSDGGGMAEIRVADNGRGIDMAFLPFVFDRFRQADSSSTRRHGGLGIGLTIVRHIVELHGGTVAATSAGRNTGATFTVRLPIKPVADLVETSSGEPARAPGTNFPPHSPAELPDRSAEDERREFAAATQLPDVPPVSPITAQADYQLIGCDEGRTEAQTELAGLKILIVEDDRDARILLAEVMRRHAATVTAVSSAERAFDEASKCSFDVIISDVAMPNEDGYSLLRRLREAGCETPAIAVTAYAREDDRREAINAGFQDHIAKPVSSVKLLAALLHLLHPTQEVTAKLG